MRDSGRRRAVRWAGALIAGVILVSACGDGDGGQAVEVEGDREPPVAEQLAGSRAPEPAWRSEVPPVLENATDAKEPPANSLAPLASASARAVASSSSASASASAKSTTYRGTMTIDVAYYGLDCSYKDIDLHHLGDRTYEMPVEVVRGPRANADGVRESSPFNLLVGTDSREGGIQLQSALVVAEDDELVLFEFWEITQNGSRVEGQLVNAWRVAFGSVMNNFFTRTLWIPCRPDLGDSPYTTHGILEGAELKGTITDSRVDLTVVGQTTQKIRAFRARIKATNVKRRTSRTTTTR